MFLHLGGDIIVSKKNIIAIMNLETTSVSKITNEFFKKSTEKNMVINIKTEELPKSYVLTREQGEKKLYISPISSQTLNKRFKSNDYKKVLGKEWKECRK